MHIDQTGHPSVHHLRYVLDGKVASLDFAAGTSFGDVAERLSVLSHRRHAWPHGIHIVLATPPTIRAGLPLLPSDRQIEYRAALWRDHQY